MARISYSNQALTNLEYISDFLSANGLDALEALAESKLPSRTQAPSTSHSLKPWTSRRGRCSAYGNSASGSPVNADRIGHGKLAFWSI